MSEIYSRQHLCCRAAVEYVPGSRPRVSAQACTHTLSFSLSLLFICLCSSVWVRVLSFLCVYDVRAWVRGCVGACVCVCINLCC